MVKIHDIRYRTKRTNGTRKLSQVKNIARHHSATATGNFDTFWKYWNGTRGWGTGGYHEIILRDGSVELCYGPEEITNGVANLNSKVYNICLVGNGSFTDEQERVFDERAKVAMKLFNLPVSAVKGHGEFPGSNTSCPGIDMNIIRKRLAGDVVEQVSKPKPPPAPSKPVAKPSTTNSIVDYLNALKIDSSPANRRKLATAYGVKNYDLSAAKNIELLNKMRAGKPVKAKPKSKSISQMASEVEALKHGKGHDNRRKSLGISRAEYNKVRAEVNRRAGIKATPKKATQTVSQMANRIITDKKAPTGHEARRKWLGIDNATYQKVRAEVNRRM